MQIFAQNIMIELHRSDLAGKYSGDKFVNAFPHTDIHKVQNVVEKIRSRISSRKVLVGDKLVSVPRSFGISNPHQVRRI